MTGSLRALLRQILPPAGVRLARGLLSRHGWRGDYESWEAARAASTGYDSDLILEKVSRSVAAVLDGRAAFERDSVAFGEAEYRWPMLASVLWAASSCEKHLTVMDVGGSLATTYLQHRTFLENGPGIRWMIVEQPHYVARGRELLAGERPEFYDSIEACLGAASPDLVLFGSSLQYFPDPKAVLGSALSTGARYLLIDRTPLSEAGRDRLVVQSVPPSIYRASYPCWLLDRASLLRDIRATHRLVAELPCEDKGNLPGVSYRGFLFERST